MVNTEEKRVWGIHTMIAQLRAMKATASPAVLTPEEVLQSRRIADQMCGGLPVPKEITTEAVKLGNIDAEFCHYTGQDAVSTEKVALFFHGGGFMNGSIASRRYFCTTVLKYAKMNGYSVEYRQYPEGKHPDGLMDCLEAFQELQKLGYKPENIYCFGESAGSMLCLMMTMYLKDHGQAVPGKLSVFSPVINVNEDYPSRIEREDRDPMTSGKVNEGLTPYVDEVYRTSPYLSTAYGDFTGFPQIQIHVGTEEVLFDDSRVLYEKCLAAGVDVRLRIWDGLFHSFPLFPTPEAEQAAKEIAAFLDED